MRYRAPEMRAVKQSIIYPSWYLEPDGTTGQPAPFPQILDGNYFYLGGLNFLGDFPR